MARLSRSQSQALTRQKLLKSASFLMSRVGYENASIDQIAENAGFSKGAFYSNFANKEAIFLELLEQHAAQDIEEISALLEGEEDPLRIIGLICDWSTQRASNPDWGLLALELFRRARREATFGKRHAELFKYQWTEMGKLLKPLFLDGKPPASPETLGGIVFELTYGAAASFTSGPDAGDLIRVCLMSLYEAHNDITSATKKKNGTVKKKIAQ